MFSEHSKLWKLSLTRLFRVSTNQLDLAMKWKVFIPLLESWVGVIYFSIADVLGLRTWTWFVLSGTSKREISLRYKIRRKIFRFPLCTQRNTKAGRPTATAYTKKYSSFFHLQILARRRFWHTTSTWILPSVWDRFQKSRWVHYFDLVEHCQSLLFHFMFYYRGSSGRAVSCSAYFSIKWLHVLVRHLWIR